MTKKELRELLVEYQKQLVVRDMFLTAAALERPLRIPTAVFEGLREGCGYDVVVDEGDIVIVYQEVQS